VRSFSSRELGVGVLFAPILGFLPPKDPRITGTLEAVWRKWQSSPLSPSRLKGGLLLVSALARSERPDEAADLLEKLCSLGSSLGLFSEELSGSDLVGAFPSASVHAQLICVALDVRAARQASGAIAALHQGGLPQGSAR